MEAPASQQWFLRKSEDGSVFGPLPFSRLQQWAATAQVAPNDTVSSDAITWMKAPMLPDLGMDWIVEITSEHYYGPTTLGAINEFLRLEEINDETAVINACDGRRYQVTEIASLLQDAAAAVAETTREPAADVIAEAPLASGISISPEDRIRQLEQALREERRALTEAEERYRDLQTRYSELLGSRSDL